MTLDQWLIFIAVWTVAGLPLGPSALNCIASAAGNGFGRSLRSIAGILLAALCLMAATILGMATLLLANATAFQLVKLVGAGYLIWMGISLWRKPGTAISIARPAPAPVHVLVRRAFLVAMCNPKAILAYLAVFSQFVRPEAALAEQLLILVPTAQAITAMVYLGYCAAGTGIGRLLETARHRLVFNRGVGSIYAACGIGLMTVER